MRVSVDADVCTGHGRCYTRAPSLIEPDDEGFPVLLMADIPDELVKDAQLAASACPEGAVKLAGTG